MADTEGLVHKGDYRGYEMWVTSEAEEDGKYYSATRGGSGIATGYGSTQEAAIADLKESIDMLLDPALWP